MYLMQKVYILCYSRKKKIISNIYSYIHSWKFWYSYHKKNQNSREKFGSVLNEIITFDNLETFWRAYNNIITIEHLPSNTDLGH